MPNAVFEPYMPNKNETIEQRIKGLTNAYADFVQQLQYIMGNLDHKNIPTLNKIVGDIKGAYTRIEQTESEISLKVSKGNIISEINQSAEEIKISAEKVNLIGAVTFSAFDSSTQILINSKVDASGVTTIIGGTVTTDYINALGITARQLTTVNGSTVLADVYKDDNGGKLALYDNEGNINVRLGVEGVGGGNVGGTFALYNDSIAKQRVGMGTFGIHDCGVLLLYNPGNVGTIYMSAWQESRPWIALFDGDDNLRSYFSTLNGMINNEIIATQDWAIAQFSSISHTHTGVYSPTGHNHDGTYSPVGHTHSSYVTITDLVNVMDAHIQQYHSS